MMRIEHYRSTNSLDDDIKEAIILATRDQCIINISYSAFHHLYEVNVYPGDTLEKIKSKLPQTYGL